MQVRTGMAPLPLVAALSVTTLMLPTIPSSWCDPLGICVRAVTPGTHPVDTSSLGVQRVTPIQHGVSLTPYVPIDN
jgi:hypothetical protein